ncbi:monodechloroaminopyrrolnitrin synthase PrnB family protein [Alkalihalobacillus sp. TS-13]|uniref:monodechloroaminopyrrolnitrin synthase PrnB family protein n=1 Tax=Alkalihalobacillus sp. TS-13 TaxID=2842455 RepID=UPI001C88A168|nr:monodechloroaminopyrrolnitrin synthase PrnB family protein [Alkalihalobacillus sp. TS-13]
MVELKSRQNSSIDSIFPLEKFSEYVVNDLPEHNLRNEVEDIRKGENFLPEMKMVEHIAYNEPYSVKITVMGDLGIYLVSCLKANVPQSEVSSIIDKLELLSLVTGVVPRDTYASYVTYNPSEALRTFSGDESEVGFIQQHKVSDDAIKPAAEKAFALQNYEYDKETRIAYLQDIIECLKVLRKENKAVHQKVDPKYFISLFRDYFFPITMNGQDYNAPSGVHIANIILLDIIVGTADDNYFATTYELLPYLEPSEQLKIQHSMKNDSLKKQFVKNYLTHKNNDDEIEYLKEIFKMLKYYRYVHQGLVTRYIRKQDNAVSHGTGGFPFDEFLQERIDITEAAQRDMEEAFKDVNNIR